MKIAGGISEDGVIIGNTYNKYQSENWVVRRIMGSFDNALSGLVDKCDPQAIHEVGCGEGYWVVRWLQEGRDARGSDFSEKVIEMAKSHAAQNSVEPSRFTVRSVYDVDPAKDMADLVVCCEVMEHLDEPTRALDALQKIVKKDLIISVPREPLWRILNTARGKYVRDLGNTPGHVQHWSKRGIIKTVEPFFDIVEVLSPLPWTMIHCRCRRS